MHNSKLYLFPSIIFSSHNSTFEISLVHVDPRRAAIRNLLRVKITIACTMCVCASFADDGVRLTD